MRWAFTGFKGVSIPERVWGGLEPDRYTSGVCLRTVSIPERVWGGLELSGLASGLTIASSFNP